MIHTEIRPAKVLQPELREQILVLCTRAYGVDFRPYLDILRDPVHLLVYSDDTLVSHAAWVQRRLQQERGPMLRTAYVEAVATDPDWQQQGLATTAMRALQSEIQSFEIAALSPADRAFYTRLDWELWRGPLGVRISHERVPTPDGEAMILRLRGTPELDLDAALSIEWRPGEIW